ncbi:MAG: hypothetical protein ACFFD4_32655 [Candidatus Odinarchaeota archaeon]
MSSEEQNLRILGLTLLIGAIYDSAVGISTLLAPDLIATSLGIIIPREAFYYRLAAVLLLLLSFFYLLGYLQTEKNIAIVPGSIVARTGGFLFLAIYPIFLGESPAWLLLSVVDLLFLIVHYYFLRRSGYSFFSAILGEKRRIT